MIFAGPILLSLLVTFLQDTSQPVQNGYIYTAAIFLVTLIAALCTIHFNYLVLRVAIQFRAAIITAMYQKLLKVSSATLSESGFSTGQMANFMSTDVDRIVNFCSLFHSFWSMPMQLLIALFLLYREVKVFSNEYSMCD